MQLVGAETGQSLQLVHMDEVRPLRGGVFIPDFIKVIMERYRFQSIAERKEADQPLKFEAGVIELNKISIPITSLEIYGDGFIVNTRHTDDSDVIVDDFIAWMLRTFDTLREPKTWLPRRYQSRLIVDLDRPVGDTFFANFMAINKIIMTAFGTDQNLEPQIIFAPHPLGELPLSRTWSFQPRASSQPYVPNRYFSVAPLSTDSHFRMLCDLEAAATKR